MKKKYIAGLIGLVLLVVGATVYANPKFFLSRTATAVATTTVSYMTPGTSTTTLTYDTWSNPDNSTIIRNERLAQLSLGVQIHASSTVDNATSTRLQWHYEYSNDNVDWYPESVFSHTNNATTTVDITDFHQYELLTSSSSVSGFSITDAFRDYRIVDVPVLTRYIRVIFSLKDDSVGIAGLEPENNGAVWAEFIPLKENHE